MISDNIRIFRMIWNKERIYLYIKGIYFMVQTIFESRKDTKSKMHWMECDYAHQWPHIKRHTNDEKSNTKLNIELSRWNKWNIWKLSLNK